MHLRHTQNVIIDLRGNPGGDDSFSDPMVAYFASKPFWFCSRFSVKTSELTKKFRVGVTDTTLKDIRAAILSHNDGEVFDTPLPTYSPRTDSLKFTGHVYVLVNRRSFSNATTTAALVQDYHFGKIVGETTADRPTLYAAEHDFKLPHTQLTVTYPKAYMIRPNGSTSRSGVVPDYTFKDDGLGKEDKTLNYTLELIRENKY
jgi:C-terminal processing protease CtpA/Prc